MSLHLLSRILSRSRPVSRVLSWTIIHLGLQSLTGSSNLPDPDAGHAKRSYLVLLRVEFTLPHTVTSGAVRSYRTLSPLPDPKIIGGLLSAALVVGFRRPDVIWHPTLWSPDFPPPNQLAAIVWPTPTLDSTCIIRKTLAMNTAYFGIIHCTLLCMA